MMAEESMSARILTGFAFALMLSVIPAFYVATRCEKFLEWGLIIAPLPILWGAIITKEWKVYYGLLAELPLPSLVIALGVLAVLILCSWSKGGNPFALK